MSASASAASAAPADRSGRRDGWIAFALSFVWLWITAWARPLSLPDEGRYVGVAWEGLQHGDWLVPTLNGLPFFHKPPLFYWITEASMAVFGPGVWAARAAPLIGGLVGAMSLFMLLRRWMSPAHAWGALLTLLAMPLYFVGSQFANLDMLVAGMITATIAAGADAALRANAGLPHRRMLAAAYALAGLGILAKGLIGIVLPGAVLLLWLGLSGQWRTIRTLLWIPGIALMLLVCAPWFIAMQLRFPGFLHYFFVVQHVQRFAGGGFNNVQPMWFYPVVLMVATLPALPWLFKGWKGALWRPAPGPQGLHWLLLVWFAVILLFFSIPQSKLVGYILPTLPPLAGLIAVAWQRVVTLAPRWQRWGYASIAVGAVIGIAAVAAYGLGAGKSNRHLARELAALRQPQDGVVMLERFEYDVPFYARLRAPMVVVEDWNDTELMARDSWRKELWDTRDFVDAGRDLSAFQTWSSIKPIACSRQVVWAIGDIELAKAHPWLDKAELVGTDKHMALWRLRASALDCSS
ncbi:glycosyltransferase family 39 protein [Mitsuaria sp. 7]|uniref:ArnT family glycosyltransferase n=1 Tax=Mitsuaria sp. 7 TaxID=1658665 RepID=UPI001E431606|nr:glycosyltransferase family 39 protein [Mitsuaria sp. 7]